MILRDKKMVKLICESDQIKNIFNLVNRSIDMFEDYIDNNAFANKFLNITIDYINKFLVTIFKNDGIRQVSMNYIFEITTESDNVGLTEIHLLCLNILIIQVKEYPEAAFQAYQSGNEKTSPLEHVKKILLDHIPPYRNLKNLYEKLVDTETVDTLNDQEIITKRFIEFIKELAIGLKKNNPEDKCEKGDYSTPLKSRWDIINYGIVPILLRCLLYTRITGSTTKAAAADALCAIISGNNLNLKIAAFKDGSEIDIILFALKNQLYRLDVK